MLIAKQPILYQNRMYGAGETLPYDPVMNRAWLDSKTAEERMDNDKVAEAVKAPAASVSEVPETPAEDKPKKARKK